MAYKHDYDKILTRLTNILSKLYNGEALSIKELSEEFNTSTRTIQRDFNERLISFPIYKEGKRWKMQEGFKLEKMTSIEDAVVLDIMEGLIDGSSGLFSSKAKKLLSKIKNEEYNPIYTKLDIEDISDKLAEVQQLESAIKSKLIITCTYDFGSYEKELRLKALKIANYEGFWYLLSLDTKDGHLKKYYLKNISGIKLLEEHFESDISLDKKLDNALSIWFDETVKPFEVKLLVSPKIAKYLKRKPISNSQKILDVKEDGSIELSIMITHEMEIMPLVKYWIPYIKVLEPSWIRELVEEDLKKYLS
ncbi:MAG TPA: WYL domain-containing protein [Sulfurospirillum arcachonense]|nr:WYL domain-containing protein [Sulfurospirillum arcachonense]HIP45197.1 WYL domain-containing protein [Sulfurospirillum arcachonense]